ncbi:MAG: hypothetical protein BWY83_02042 [bacterium ADurb.Bin478]|nr:MAG: hypothetical protein BWY83_02042 [bacterium ADurb.Bin478]
MRSAGRYIADVMTQIQEDVGVRRLRKGVAMEPHPLSDGQLCLYLVVLEQDAIVTRGGGFILVVKA